MILKNFNFWCMCVVFVVSAAGIDVEIGNVIDLFHHYGTLTHLFPSSVNYYESPPIKFSQNIFSPQTLRNRVISGSTRTRSGVWKTAICENLANVLKAFFENYRIDLVEQIENSFASTDTKKHISQFFGISHRFLVGGYCYVLIAYRQNDAWFRIAGDSAPTEFALDVRIVDALENVTLGNAESVLHFVSQFGSHYFKSFSAGDVIYQLFALPENQYECLKKFEQNFAYEDILNCVNASEIWPGYIKTLSNAKTTESAFNRAYKSNQGLYPNLFVAKYRNFTRYAKMAEKFALTGFDLAAISDVIPNPKSSFIHEVINNQMKLRELYLFIN